jgi:hypothetical protein
MVQNEPELLSYQHQTQPYQTLSYWTQTPTQSDATLAGHTIPDPTVPDPTVPAPTLLEPTLTNSASGLLTCCTLYSKAIWSDSRRVLLLEAVGDLYPTFRYLLSRRVCLQGALQILA